MRLRKPQIHKRLGINNILGLSNLLIDKKAELSKTVPVKGINNLDILTSKRCPILLACLDLKG